MDAYEKDYTPIYSFEQSRAEGRIWSFFHFSKDKQGIWWWRKWPIHYSGPLQWDRLPRHYKVEKETDEEIHIRDNGLSNLIFRAEYWPNARARLPKEPIQYIE